MIIQSGTVGMDSARQYSRRQIEFSTIKIEGNTTQKAGGTETVSDEDKAGSKFDDLMERYKSTQSLKPVSLKDRIDTISRIRMQTLDYLLYILFGRRIDDNLSNTTNNTSDESTAEAIEQTMTEAGNISANGLLTSYTASSFQYNYFCEQETTGFSTTGMVVTSDGRSIEFNVELEMTRSFAAVSASQMDFSVNAFKDPLVINLDCSASDVRDQKFLFDIDADGILDSISRLGPGSGYLALDKNDDGEINDGSELFGTQSGNGFEDLAKYDSDGNGWIDEADDIFDKLKVWCMDESGKGTLIDLKTAGVGAMYLGSADTEFSLNNAYNQTNAVIRRTGLFLYESGQMGTMQQLDLAT